MEDELTPADLGEIIDALNWKRRAIEDRPIEPLPGESHREAYMAKVERRRRVEEIIRKVRVLEPELKRLQG